MVGKQMDKCTKNESPWWGFQNTFTAKLLMVFNRIKDHIYIKSFQEKWVVLIFNGLDFPWFLKQRILRFHRIVGLVFPGIGWFSFGNWTV